MPMTVVITVNVPMKYRGFLASCMLEIAPGVYSHPKMTAGIRTRVWDVLKKWFYEQIISGSVLMIWADSSMPGGQGVLCLGLPQRVFVTCGGVLLSRLSEQERAEEELRQKSLWDKLEESTEITKC